MIQLEDDDIPVEQDSGIEDAEKNIKHIHLKEEDAQTDDHYELLPQKKKFNSEELSSRMFDVEKLKSFFTLNSNHGLTGMQSSGSSSYVNCILQCMSHSLDLTYYFLSRMYLEEINSNPESNSNTQLGLKPGQISTILYNILYHSWILSDDSFNPHKLRQTIAESIPFFNNSNQHDANEYLIYLLDLIHQDLSKEAQVDDCQAKEDTSSNHFKLYNKSIIADLFYGQIKSTLTCLACNFQKITFEPFLTLSLAIPKLKRVDVIIVPAINIKSTFKLAIYISDSAAFLDIEMYLKKSIIFSGNKFGKYRVLLFNGKNSSVKFANMYENIYSTSLKFEIFICEIEEKNSVIGQYYSFISLLKTLDESNQIFTRNFSYPRLFTVKTSGTIKMLRMSIYGYLRKYFPLPDILSEHVKQKYSKMNDNYIHCKFLEESEYDQIIEEEYHLLFETNSSPNLPDAVSQAIHLYLTSFPYICKLVYQDTDANSINFFCGDIVDCNQTLQDSDPIQKLNELLKTGYQLVIDLSNCSLYPDIAEKMNNMMSIINASSIKCNLTDCIDHFSLHEMLEKENQWYCPQCKTLQNASKKLDLINIPKNFVIYLKRFDVKVLSKSKIKAVKNNIPVIYPVNGFNISDSCRGSKEQKNISDLYAVCQHSGGTEGGHYTSTCRNLGKWYVFDDENVRKIDDDQIVSPEAYMLFYKRLNKAQK